MLTVQANESAANVVSGTIDAVDSGAKTIGVKTADGTKYTVKLGEKTTVMGADDVAKATTVAAKSTALGAKKGSQSSSTTPKKVEKRPPTESRSSATRR